MYDSHELFTRKPRDQFSDQISRIFFISFHINDRLVSVTIVAMAQDAERVL